MLYVVMEDSGAADFMRLVKPITPFRQADVEIIDGGGKDKAALKCAELRDAGIPVERIVPILDADKITDHPRHALTVAAFPNLIRLRFDFEFPFTTEPPWMLAELLCTGTNGPFGTSYQPDKYRQCEQIVRQARVAVVERRGRSTYDCLEQFCREAYVRQGGEATQFVLPTKRKMAHALAIFANRTQYLPDELQKVGDRISQYAARVAGTLPVTTSINSSLDPDLKINAKDVKDLGVSGRLAFTFGQEGVWCLDFATTNVTRIPWALGTLSANWSPDGRIAASSRLPESGGKRLAVVVSGDSIKPRWITRATLDGSEHNPCWGDRTQKMWLMTDAGTCEFDLGTEKWKELYRDQAAFHCVHPKGGIARTTYVDSKYCVQIAHLTSPTTLRTVPNLTDARGSVSWSPDGEKLALVNWIEEGRGAVCIYDSRKNSTEFVTPHWKRPAYVAWSPDSRFIAFTLSEAGVAGSRGTSIWILEVSKGQMIPVFESPQELLLGCHMSFNP